MEQIRSISATKISSFLSNFDVYGISVDDVLLHYGINPLVLSSPDNRLSATEAQKIIDAATKLTNDDNLGLHQGERLSKGFSNILGYVLMNCSTLKECWMKYCRYEKIIDSTSISDLNIINNYAVLTNATVDETLANNRQFSDFKIAGMLSYIKLLSNKKLQLHEVHFTHTKPKDISEYERIFQSKICFGKSENALIFNSELLNIPVIEPNENLLAIFEKNAAEIFETLASNTYTNMVNEIVFNEIEKCNLPSIDVVAKQLLLSTRSLQLYLNKEGTSYIKLVKELRKKIAEKYLKDNKISIDEIAYVLGFSEASAFHRAFKNWTGLTPVQFRKSILDS